MDAIAAFGIVRGDIVALVGGGGKTTLSERLAAEARAAGWRTLCTTTTKCGPREGPCVVEAEARTRTAAARSALDRDGFAFVVSARDERRWIGVEPEWVGSVAADLTVVEADGSRKKPLKAHAAHEPVIPAAATLVVAVVGAEAIGAPLDASLVHRWELFPEVTTPEALAAYVESPAGYRKGVACRFVPFINKVSRARTGMVESMVAALRSPRVVWGEAQEGRFDVRH